MTTAVKVMACERQWIELIKSKAKAFKYFSSHYDVDNQWVLLRVTSQKKNQPLWCEVFVRLGSHCLSSSLPNQDRHIEMGMSPERSHAFPIEELFVPSSHFLLPERVNGNGQAPTSLQGGNLVKALEQLALLVSLCLLVQYLFLHIFLSKVKILSFIVVCSLTCSSIGGEGARGAA